MNYLSLCQRLRLECGISGTGPVTVSGQVGELAEVVEWIGSAYQDIQLLYPNWRFMQHEFSFPTVAGTKAYADTTVTDLAEWIPSDVRCYESLGDENPMCFEHWVDFRAVRDLGTVTAGRPTHYSVKPDNSLILWPTPNKVFTVRGEHIQTPDELSVDADIPIIPPRYHMVIVWRALSYYAGALAAPEKIGHAANEYRRMMLALKASQLPPDDMWEPLA